MLSVFIFFYTIVVSLLVFFTLQRLSRKIGLVETNYRGKQMLIGSGLLIPILLISLLPLYSYISTISQWLTYCIFTLSLGIIGFIDDRYGEKKIKGLKGHILYLWKHGKVTTGFLKLVSIILIGFWLSAIIYDALFDIFVATCTFAIWTNMFNLLDVRPGRAIKGFWFVSIILFCLHIREIGYLEWMLLLVSVVLFIIDIFEWGMLGDIGSNILGGVVGYWLIAYASQIEMFLFLFSGGFLTYYAERKSFSQWIEKHPLIDKIDQWGRKVTD